MHFQKVWQDKRNQKTSNLQSVKNGLKNNSIWSKVQPKKKERKLNKSNLFSLLWIKTNDSWHQALKWQKTTKKAGYVTGVVWRNWKEILRTGQLKRYYFVCIFLREPKKSYTWFFESTWSVRRFRGFENSADEMPKWHVTCLTSDPYLEFSLFDISLWFKRNRF